MKIIVLGCGSSLGVPVICCDCKICKSKSGYNKRTRCALYIEYNDTKLLIDCGFDIKDQIIKANINKLDAVIITHIHADQTAGIDNLRVFPFIYNKPLSIFADTKTMCALKDFYGYLLKSIEFNTYMIDFYDKLKIGMLDIQLIKLIHDTDYSLGIKIGNFLYSSDVSDFPEESVAFLYDLDTWILDCIGYSSTSGHSGLDKVFQWYEKYKPKRIFLTNMSHEMDYYRLCDLLPKNIIPLYDGYQLTV